MRILVSHLLIKQRVRRLFVMDEVVFAKDIETDEMLGIESMNVAP